VYSCQNWGEKLVASSSKQRKFPSEEPCNSNKTYESYDSDPLKGHKIFVHSSQTFSALANCHERCTVLIRGRSILWSADQSASSVLGQLISLPHSRHVMVNSEKMLRLISCSLFRSATSREAGCTSSNYNLLVSL
jgi:hypothetical protein